MRTINIPQSTVPAGASGFCFLRDQQPISPEAYRRALAICATIRMLVASRADYVSQARLPADIHLPRANWQLDCGLFSAYQTVAKADYAVINNLRLFSQVFTGFQLMSLARVVNEQLPREVPPDLDRTLAQLAAGPAPDVDVYRDLTAYLPPELHIAPPNIFGEVGWLVDGKIVNHDTNVYLERIAMLAESGKLWEMRNRSPASATARNRSWQRPRIVEIGSGYGGLAHYIRTLIPEARYFLVDIPESLLFSSIYLSTLWDQDDNVLITPDNLADLGKDSPGFTFVPNYLFDHCRNAGLEFDLAINTLSMSEMSAQQIRYYCAGLAQLLGRRGVFFEQNQDNRRHGLADAKRIIARCFPWCIVLRPPAMRTTQGQPHLWAVHHEEPYANCGAWLPSDEALGRLSLLRVRRMLARTALGNAWRSIKPRLRKGA
jgi:hypothetical protein